MIAGKHFRSRGFLSAKAVPRNGARIVATLLVHRANTLMSVLR